jgi:hypothetical protein
METSRNFARIVDRRKPGVEQSRLNERVLTDWLAHSGSGADPSPSREDRARPRAPICARFGMACREVGGRTRT